MMTLYHDGGAGHFAITIASDIFRIWPFVAGILRRRLAIVPDLMARQPDLHDGTPSGRYGFMRAFTLTRASPRWRRPCLLQW